VEWLRLRKSKLPQNERGLRHVSYTLKFWNYRYLR